MEGSQDLHPAVETSYTEINMSRIQVGGGMVGLLFALGTAFIFAFGLPAVRAFLVCSVVAGSGISVALYLFHRHRPIPPQTNLSI